MYKSKGYQTVREALRDIWDGTSIISMHVEDALRVFCKKFYSKTHHAYIVREYAKSLVGQPSKLYALTNKPGFVRHYKTLNLSGQVDLLMQNLIKLEPTTDKTDLSWLMA